MEFPEELELALEDMLLTEICLGSDVCRREDFRRLFWKPVTPGKVLLGLYWGGLTYAGGCEWSFLS